jgi:hypothetical protein
MAKIRAYILLAAIGILTYSCLYDDLPVGRDLTVELLSAPSGPKYTSGLMIT